MSILSLVISNYKALKFYFIFNLLCEHQRTGEICCYYYLFILTAWRFSRIIRPLFLATRIFPVYLIGLMGTGTGTKGQLQSFKRILRHLDFPITLQGAYSNLDPAETAQVNQLLYGTSARSGLLHPPRLFMRVAPQFLITICKVRRDSEFFLVRKLGTLFSQL